MYECEGPFCEVDNPHVQFYKHYDTEEVLCEECARLSNDPLNAFRPLRRSRRV
jgi:hypothetical protein